MRMRSWLFGALLVLSVSAQHARAQGDAKANKPSKPSKQSEADKADEASDDEQERDRIKPISVALLAGYGLALNEPNHLNPFGIGFGVRGGYDIGPLYVGARFLFFLGDSEEISGVEASANSITLGLETGYRVELLEKLILQPEIGGGLVVQSAESMTSGAAGTEVPMDESSEVLYIAPGFALLAYVGRRSYVGIDVQLPIMFDDDTVLELTMFATGGMRF